MSTAQKRAEIVGKIISYGNAMFPSERLDRFEDLVDEVDDLLADRYHLRATHDREPLLVALANEGATKDDVIDALLAELRQERALGAMPPDGPPLRVLKGVT